VSVKREPITLDRVRPGHMITHDGQHKIVDGTSAGNIAGVWSLRIDFTDSTQLVIPYAHASDTVEVITSFY
jgi:hypothetical protein